MQRHDVISDEHLLFRLRVEREASSSHILADLCGIFWKFDFKQDLADWQGHPLVQ